MSAPAQYPELPEPADSAYINGPQGGEYRSLANSFEPGCAMFSPDQMRAYVDAAREQDRARAAAPDHWQRQGAEAWHAVCDALIKNWGDGALSEGSEGVMRLVEMLATEAKAYRAAGRPLSRAAAPQPAVGVSDEQIEAIALARYKVVPAHGSMFWSHAVVAGDGVQQLYVGRDVECQNMAAKFTGAFLDGAFVAISATKPEAPASEQQRLMINFDQVGTAGPFPVVDGRVHLPSVTMLDLARMLKPTMDLAAAPIDSENEAVDLLRRYKKLCIEIGRGDSHHLSRIDRALESVAAAPPPAVGVSDEQIVATYESITGLFLTPATGQTRIIAAIRAILALSPASKPEAPAWDAPTTYLQRLGDAIQALCSGHRPADEMMTAYLETECTELQEFCINHGPSWAQGVGVIDAARLLADQPTEGVGHEFRAAPAEAPANEGVSDAESLYEFKVRLNEYGLAMRNGNGEKARVLAEVLASMLSTATQPISADVSQVSDVLVYVDAGHLREVLNGNDMCIFASAQQDEQGRLTPLTALAEPAQGDAKVLADAELLHWLESQLVDTIYLDDGRIIDVGTGRIGQTDVRVAPHALRDALRAARQSKGGAA